MADKVLEVHFLQLISYNEYVIFGPITTPEACKLGPHHIKTR